MTLIIALIVCLGVMAFAYVGIQLFTESWEKDEKYEELENNIDLILLTLPPQHLTYLSFLSAFLGIGLAGLFLGFDFYKNPMGMIVVGSLCGALPAFYIKMYRKKRQKMFGIQLIDALSSLSNSLRAGHALPKAVELLAMEAPEPLRSEMQIVVQEMRLGESLVQALRNLEKRMPNEDLDLLATAIDIAGEVGGNLTEVFDNIAHTIRERNKIEGKINAMTSQGKAQGVVVAFLPLVLGLAINFIDPQLFRPMYTTLVGWIMIGVVILLEIIAFFIIMKIVTIKV
ncbi:MAG: hypothetical protein D6785_07225 [Planctomycetota bacterium]|nr:MAG: hypothetical protein D6785_07225 [Planctomycetota bacterium]